MTVVLFCIDTFDSNTSGRTVNSNPEVTEKMTDKLFAQGQAHKFHQLMTKVFLKNSILTVIQANS